MKKLLLSILLLLLITVSACSSNNDNEKEKENVAPSNNTESEETIVYDSENGPIEVPANPERIIVLSTYAGDVLKLGGNIVGADSWSMDNPNFAEGLANAEEVSDESLEKIIELEPDLIIGLSTIKNIDKLNEIAPTVTFTYGKVDYLQQHIEIGKLLNKEKEATEWVKDFEQRAKKLGEDIKAKIGEDATVSVIEDYEKQLYVFGDNWGRGTEILYQAMGLKMPDKVKEMALTDGYYALSLEVLPEYAGDYMIFSRSSGADKSYVESDIYKNIPAVQNGQVFEVDQRSFYFNDATTLEFQLDFFEEKFLQD